MRNNIKIPVALQMVIDDVGWHKGHDQRYKSWPSRSGLPRMHQPIDYVALNAVGKGLDMKVTCPFVIGEWDKDNVLRGVPHLTYNEQGWDRASEIDMAYAERCFEAAEGSEYLEYALHGILHGYYVDGKCLTEAEFYPHKYDAEKGCYTKEQTWLSREEFEQHIEMFYKIYDSWGFKKKIQTFVSPCGSVGTPQDNTHYAEWFKEHGMIYWANTWRDFPEGIDVAGGVICTNKIPGLPWEAYDIDPTLLELKVKEDVEHPRTIWGGHWTNFLRYHPENNMERVPAWIDYFKKHAEVFGCMLSKDIGFSSSQAVYNRFASIEVLEHGYRIDLNEVDNKGAVGLRNEFYISLKNGTVPKACSGGTISEYETHDNFKTYKIVRDGKKTVEIILE